MSERFGLSAAMTLPVMADGAVDLKRLADHARWCLASGCGSVAAFGTTGEGASLGLSAREQIVGALIGAGIDARRSIVGGVSASSVHEAIVQTRLLMDANCRAVLMAPPFYFKGVTDEGLYAWYARVFEKLGSQARDVILYNIPSVTAVPLSVELIGRLRAGFPEVVSGVKDSSGDFAYTKSLLAAHGDLAILIGDERHLSEGIRLGAQGSISGLANLCPADLDAMIANGRDDPRIPLMVEEVLKHPVTPAVKALVAHRTGDATWLNVRPPLVALDQAAAAKLGAAFDTIFAAKAA
jgi:4-hydroxy-tetrahydrodipicolinate synthase